MSRVGLVEPSQFSEEFKKLSQHAGDNVGYQNLFGAQANCQELFTRFYHYYFYQQFEGVVSPVIKELVRLRVANMNGCMTCIDCRYPHIMEMGLTEEKIQASIGDYKKSDKLTDKEKIAIEFGEMICKDHHAINNDAFFVRMKKHFNDAELMELGWAVSQYVGGQRVTMVLQLEEQFCSMDVSKLKAVSG